MRCRSAAARLVSAQPHAARNSADCSRALACGGREGMRVGAASFDGFAGEDGTAEPSARRRAGLSELTRRTVAEPRSDWRPAPWAAAQLQQLPQRPAPAGARRRPFTRRPCLPSRCAARAKATSPTPARPLATAPGALCERRRVVVSLLTPPRLSASAQRCPSTCGASFLVAEGDDPPTSTRRRVSALCSKLLRSLRWSAVTRSAFVIAGVGLQ